MRRSLRRPGFWGSPRLVLRLSQFTSTSLMKKKKQEGEEKHDFQPSQRLSLLRWVLHYITARPWLSGGSVGLQAEESLLQLNQLTPQRVFLRQHSGDHGLGFVSGEVRLNRSTQDITHPQTSTSRQRLV